jgi:putative SOS response-associated peptidase YedK
MNCYATAAAAAGFAHCWHVAIVHHVELTGIVSATKVRIRGATCRRFVASGGQFRIGFCARTLPAMCDRLVIPDRQEVEQELSVNNPWWKFSTRFNVAATQSVPVARMHDKESEGVMMRWGLVPSTTQGPDFGPGAPSVRSTAIESAEDYRTVWLYGQRCIVPLAGFYIWQRTTAGYRQPFYVRLVNRAVFGVAALWDRVVTDDDDVIEGCALITVPPNKLLAEIDNTGGQMPAILPRDSYQTWLNGRPAQAKSLLNAYPPERMVTHAVGPHVNFLEYDDPSLIRPIV